MSKKAAKDYYEYAVWAVLASVVTLFVTTVFAYTPPHKDSPEGRIIESIYHWPASLKSFFLVVTQMGSGWMVLAVICLLWANRRRILAYTIATTAIFTFAVVELIKTLVQRPRPPQVFVTMVSRDSMAFGYGFPSGHAAMATLLCVLLWGFVTKQLRWLLPVGAILVYVSRIYLGVHSPLDIIGGICLGLIIGLSVKMPWLKIKSRLALTARKA